MRLTTNRGNHFVPTDREIYAERLRRLQEVVREVDRHMGCGPRVVRGEPGKVAEVVEVKR